MSMIKQKPIKYDDGLVKQSFKDETDINKILARAQKTGTISHLAKHQGRYADFSNFDFFAAQLMLTKGREIFDDLPSEIRNEFNQSQAEFFTYVNDPANAGRLDQLLPGLALPGKQNIQVSGNPLADAPTESPPPEANTPPATPPATPENSAGDLSEPPQKPIPTENPPSSAPT